VVPLSTFVSGVQAPPPPSAPAATVVPATPLAVNIDPADFVSPHSFVGVGVSAGAKAAILEILTSQQQ
jgi:hypothetical protein